VARESGPQHDLVIEKDVEIPLRDGVRLCADVFRPKGTGKYPAGDRPLGGRGRHVSRPRVPRRHLHYGADCNTGQNMIFTGGTTPSHVLLPVIPRT
jgi:predicted acyl esterase